MAMTETFPILCFTAQTMLGVLVMVLAISAASAFAASRLIAKKPLEKAARILALAAFLALAAYLLMPAAAKALTGKGLDCLV